MKTLKQCLDTALLNGKLHEFMGWGDAPSLEELKKFERFFGGTIEELWLAADESSLGLPCDAYDDPQPEPDYILEDPECRGSIAPMPEKDIDPEFGDETWDDEREFDYDIPNAHDDSYYTPEELEAAYAKMREGC
jgi:hypothetical protein